MRKSVFLLASLSSGQGKTTLTLALSEIIKKRGIKLINYKVGPDYLDASFYAGYNLDSYFMTEPKLRSFFFTTASPYDVSIIEGAMGVYDGIDVSSIHASSAHIAKILNIPIILVLSPEGSVLTAISSLRGVINFEKGITFKGVIFNKLKSRNHYELLKEAVERYTHLKVYGYIPYDSKISMPERHLGLIPSWERGMEKREFLKYKDCIDVDALLRDTGFTYPLYERFSYPFSSSSFDIGIARDRAFGFYYRENIELLKALGANITYISPLNDPIVPPHLDFLYIGGGYPELYLDELSENKGFIHSLRVFSKTRPIYAECGGLMYLSNRIEYRGKVREMVGLFPHNIGFSSRIQGLGYRDVKTIKPSIFGVEGTLLTGHEFHYSYLKENDTMDYVYDIYKKGKFLRKGGISLPGGGIASYVHLYFLSNPNAILNMLRYAKKGKDELYKISP